MGFGTPGSGGPCAIHVAKRKDDSVRKGQPLGLGLYAVPPAEPDDVRQPRLRLSDLRPEPRKGSTTQARSAARCPAYPQPLPRPDSRFGPSHQGPPRGPYVLPAGQQRYTKSSRRRLGTGARPSGSRYARAGYQQPSRQGSRAGSGHADGTRPSAGSPSVQLPSHPPCGNLLGVWAKTRSHGMRRTYSTHPPVSELSYICLLSYICRRTL